MIRASFLSFLGNHKTDQFSKMNNNYEETKLNELFSYYSNSRSFAKITTRQIRSSLLVCLHMTGHGPVEFARDKSPCA